MDVNKKDPAVFSKKEKVLLGILASVQFSSIVDFMIMMPLGPQLMRLFQISPHQFGLLVSSYSFCAGLSGFTASFFMDKFDRKNMLLFFFLGFSIGTIACALAPTYELLLLARGLTGIFGGVLSSLVLSIVSDAISYERRGSAMGIIMTSFSVASIFGVPFSLYLANQFSWHAPFIFLGVASLVLCVVAYFGVPPVRGHLEHPREKEAVYQSLLRIFKNKNQIRALIFMSTVIFGHFAIIPYLSPSMVSNAGLTEEQLPLIYMIGGLFTIFTSPMIGRMSDRLGKHKVFLFGAALCTLPIFAITHLTASPAWLVLSITSVFFVVSGGRMIPATALVSGTASPQNRGSFMSIVSCVQQLSSALASYIAGIIIVKAPSGRLENYELVGYMSITVTLIAIYLSRKITATEGPQGPATEPVIAEAH
ncbi:MFS transporter [Bdellovibrio sp. SKB1291214]|uniref:MFS transporter n=1 Tax=Bdellovibrio sp. SKB1291214 TaxID=1732569 RepID=UPI000B5161B3|nr:MFS transporter [Bdellovibrio sp. SKB1291214]UYL07901.1 MFS transporter [Bdellovibrio sp. SKB1291214]